MAIVYTRWQIILTFVFEDKVGHCVDISIANKGDDDLATGGGVHQLLTIGRGAEFHFGDLVGLVDDCQPRAFIFSHHWRRRRVLGAGRVDVDRFRIGTEDERHLLASVHAHIPGTAGGGLSGRDQSWPTEGNAHWRGGYGLHWLTQLRLGKDNWKNNQQNVLNIWFRAKLIRES